MSKNKSNITSENIIEWMCSTGYLFPRNGIELARFERLYPENEIKTEGATLDPISILEGTRIRKPIKLDIEDEEINDSFQMRMAARKYQNLPEHIIEKIKQNQQKSNNDDKPED